MLEVSDVFCGYEAVTRIGTLNPFTDRAAN